MKILKGFALVILGFLLFLSLSIFSLAFWLNSTVLSPNFISSEIERLDVSALVEEALTQQPAQKGIPAELRTSLLDTINKIEPVVKEEISDAIHSVYGYLLGKREKPELAQTLRQSFFSKDFVIALLDKIPIASLAEKSISEQAAPGALPEELTTAMLTTLTKMEPEIKKQAGAAIDPVFSYLFGETQSVDLATVLRSTFLSKEFIVAVVDELDMATLAKSLISAQLTEQIPEEMSFFADYLEKGALDNTLAKIEPLVKEQIEAAADPLADYLVGKRQDFSITISLSQVMTTLKEDLKEAILTSPPPEFASLPPAVIEEQFDTFFDEFAQAVPASVEINEAMLGTGVQAQILAALTQAENELASAKQQIAAGITQAESALMLARTYVSYFQMGYWLLIVFMVLLIAGIVLIHRQVKPATRSLGTTFLTFGVIELASFFVAKYFAGAQLAQLPEVPAALETWLPQFFNNFMAPMMTFGIIIAVLGLALIIVSIVYKPREAAV